MVSELILAFVFFAPLGIVLVELLGGAADSLIDKFDRQGRKRKGTQRVYAQTGTYNRLL